MLTDGAIYEDLGAHYFERRSDSTAGTRRLVRGLKTLAHTVSITPAA